MELASEGVGWRGIYAFVASERPWSATIHAVEHFCLAYCVDGPAKITRRIAGDVSQSVLLRPGQFGSIPSGADTGWRVEGSPRVMLMYFRRSLVAKVGAGVFEGD